MKYVITEYKNFAIFSKTTNHSEIGIELFGKPISAGFCHFENGKIKCYGESISLGLKSREEDSDIINEKFNL